MNPVHPGHARLLLSSGKAAVFRRFPFTLILKVTINHLEIQPLRIKIDPGSKTTGLALVNDANGEVVFAAELTQWPSKRQERLPSPPSMAKSLMFLTAIVGLCIVVMDMPIIKG